MILTSLFSLFYNLIDRQSQRALQTLSLQLAGELVRLAAVALVDERIRVAAAGAVEFRPAIRAAPFGIEVRFREICLDLVVERSVV